MPVGAFVPSQIHLDYSEWTAPAIGSTDTGKAWAWNHATNKYEPTTFLLASAVSVYGLTLASAADAAAARTALELGTAATLNVGTGANRIVQLDGSSRLPAVDGSQLTGVTVAAAGSSTQVIYNAAGVYAGDAGLTYNASTDRLTVVGGIIAGDWSPPSDSTTAVSIWNAARSARVATVDTTNQRVGINTTPNESLDVGAGNAMANSFICREQGANRYFRWIVDSVTGAAIKLQQKPGLAGSYSDIISINMSGQINLGSAGALLFSTSGNLDLLTDTSSNHYYSRRGPAGSFSFKAGYQSAWSIGNTLNADASNTVFYIDSTGKIGVPTTSPTALLDLAASTTTRASLRIREGTAPTTPNAGDIWYPTGGRLNVYRAATETIASGVPGTGGSATATGTWGATEQAMLQAVYDIARSFGMLS